MRARWKLRQVEVLFNTKAPNQSDVMTPAAGRAYVILRGKALFRDEVHQDDLLAQRS